MHLVFLSDHETQGGAAVAAARLAGALCRNHRVTRVVLFPDGQRHPWRTVVLGQENAIASFTRRVLRKCLWPDLARPGTSTFVTGQLRQALGKLKPDIIHLHNLHGGGPWGWGLDMLEACAEAAPLVWTLHDMWSFTGRCAYAYACRQFETGCDASCPTADEAPALAPEKIWSSWERRRILFSRLPHLFGVTPSHWLAEQARAGLWKDHRLEVIPNGVPTEVYRPLDRQEARRALGIPPDKPVVLVVAHNLRERRKGAGLFPDVWRFVETPLSLLTMGTGTVEAPGIPVQALGYVDQEDRKVLAYNAADVLLHPAPVDNLPNVVLEALACGTPVVALPVGGLPEMVISHRSSPPYEGGAGGGDWARRIITPPRPPLRKGGRKDRLADQGDNRGSFGP